VKRRRNIKRKAVKRATPKRRGVKRIDSIRTLKGRKAEAGPAETGVVNQLDWPTGLLARIFSDADKQNQDTGLLSKIFGITAEDSSASTGRALIGATREGAERLKAQRAEKERKVEQIWSRIFAIPAGKRALSVLVRAGVDRDKLLEYLWLIRSVHGKKRKNLATVPGVSLDTIKGLPELLRQISRQVEAIEKHGYTLTTDQMRMLMFNRRLRGRYMLAKSLPAFLRSYADWISGLLLMRRNRAVNKLDQSTVFKVQLVQLVFETSSDRTQHYSELATAMNVFYQIEGLTQTVTAQSLKVLWGSHPTLRKLPEPIQYAPVSHNWPNCDLRGKLN